WRLGRRRLGEGSPGFARKFDRKCQRCSIRSKPVVIMRSTLGGPGSIPGIRMQRVAANPSARRPTRLLVYGTAVALGMLFLVRLNHHLWPVSFLAVATAPVVDGVWVRSQPGRTRTRVLEAPGDLAQELGALEADGYIVLTEVKAAREVIPFVVIGATGAFA